MIEIKSPPDILVVLSVSRDLSVKSLGQGLVFSLLRTRMMLIIPQGRLGAT